MKKKRARKPTPKYLMTLYWAACGQHWLLTKNDPKNINAKSLLRAIRKFERDDWAEQNRGRK